MQKEKIMSKTETEQELKFALQHEFSFSAHGFAQLLNREEVASVCKEVGVNADLTANVLQREGSKSFRAYCVLSFWKEEGEYTTSKKTIATYFSEDIISSDGDYVIDYEEERANDEF